jgi:hypothetical protein
LNMSGKCFVKLCNKTSYSHGLCVNHYQRWYRNTHPDFRRRQNETARKYNLRFKAKHPIIAKRKNRLQARLWARKHPELKLHYTIKANIKNWSYPYSMKDYKASEYSCRRKRHYAIAKRAEYNRMMRFFVYYYMRQQRAKQRRVVV